MIIKKHSDKLQHSIFIFFIIVFALVITFLTYPFIETADGHTRILLSNEILDYGKIISDTVLGPLIPILYAIIFKVTNGYGLFTLINTFVFYYSIYMLCKILTHNKFVSRIITILIIFIPIVGIFPTIQTDSSILFNIVIFILNLSYTKPNKLMYFLLTFFIFLMIATRINSLIIIPVFLVILLRQFGIDKIKYIICSIVVSFGMLFLLNDTFIKSNYKPVALGMAWEIVGISKNINSEKYNHILDFVGSTQEAISRHNNNYLNNIFWDDNPPLPVFKVVEQNNAKKIKKIYLQFTINEPIEFIKNKLDLWSRILGIKEELLPISRGIHMIDETDESYNDKCIIISNKIRHSYINSGEKLHLITKKPIIMILISSIIIILLFLIKSQNLYRYISLYGIAVIYYIGFLLNAQAHEFRYYAPTFYMLLILNVTGLLHLMKCMFKYNKLNFRLNKFIFKIIIPIIIVYLLTVTYINNNYLTIFELTDNNWTNGILNDKSEILFLNNKNSLYKLNKSSALDINNIKYNILEINYDETWIRVKIDTSHKYLPQKVSYIRIINKF